MNRIRTLVRGQTARHQAMRGSAWLMAGRVAVQVSGFVRLAVVARFLSPTEFGIMAIVLLVLQILEAFTTAGFAQALIQRSGTIDHYFPSVFVANAVRGLILAALILTASPFVASFFDQSGSVSVIQAAAVIVVVRGLQSPAIANVHRELRYKAHFLWDLGSTLAALVTALSMLLFTHSVWVLLIALIVEEVVRTLGSYVIANWTPRLNASWRDILELNRFGRWVTLGSMIVFVSLQLDSVVVGRLLDAGALGLYQMAMRISQLPVTQVSQVAATVAFPVLSRLQGQDERIRHAYLRMFSALLLINMFISGIMVVFAEPIVLFILGSRWEAAVPALRILAVAGFVRSLVTLGGKVFYAAGRPKYDSAMNAVRLFVFALLIVPMVRWAGIEGAAIAVLISISLVLPVYLVLIDKTLGVAGLDHVEYIIVSPWKLVLRYRSKWNGT